MAMILHTRAAEIRLMEMLDEIGQLSFGWQALHFHLSDLLDQYKSDYQLKIAVNLIHDLLKNYDGGIFLLTDSSIIVLAKDMEKTLEGKLIFQLRYLYADDPLTYGENGKENPNFCSTYDLRFVWREFYDLCVRLLDAFRRRDVIIDDTGAAMQPQEQQAAAKLQPEEPEQHHDKGGFSALRLAAVERGLAHAELPQAIRRQPVCAVLPDMTVRRVFEELYINIQHLRQIMKSEVDFLSDRWLFKYLTRQLDQRMLELIQRNPERYLGSPISLNLNVETLLSPTFSDFDAMLKPSMKIAIVIEVPVVDVFADITAFLLAQRELQKLGYRVCIDGLSMPAFMALNRERLPFDLIKVQWNADLQSDLATRGSSGVAAAVQAMGSNRIILCRCDDRAAVEYGHALGISLFQGRYLDSLLNPTSKVEN